MIFQQNREVEMTSKFLRDELLGCFFELIIDFFCEELLCLLIHTEARPWVTEEKPSKKRFRNEKQPHKARLTHNLLNY